MEQRKILAAVAFVFLGGCGNSSDPAAIIEDGTVDVRGEQVAITPVQVLCGEKEGLWKIEQDSNGALGRLTPAGQALGFAGDVVMGNTRFQDPYAPISGSRQLKVAKVTQVTQNDAATKTVTAGVGVVIEHRCFEAPLALHGVAAGRFSQSVEPRLRLKNESGWKVDRFLH